MKINPWIWRIYISNKSSHASNFQPEVSGRPRQKKGSLGQSRAVCSLLLVVLGMVRILGSWGVVPGSHTSGNGPQNLVKNVEGGGSTR